jgi:hypothetical protein
MASCVRTGRIRGKIFFHPGGCPKSCRQISPSGQKTIINLCFSCPTSQQHPFYSILRQKKKIKQSKEISGLKTK